MQSSMQCSIPKKKREKTIGLWISVDEVSFEGIVGQSHLFPVKGWIERQ